MGLILTQVNFYYEKYRKEVLSTGCMCFTAVMMTKPKVSNYTHHKQNTNQIGLPVQETGAMNASHHKPPFVSWTT